MNAPHDPGNARMAAVVGGDRRALARLLSQIDNRQSDALATAKALAAHAGQAHVVGITGVPGAGKSTLVNALIGHWLARGEKIAVIAVDPASPVTGGAVLGDRVRMGEHGAHPNVFIRSFSSRGTLGGLAQSTRAAIDCFDAAGFQRILVETVGAGQSEVAVARLADCSVVVCPPGLGDDVQAIKAGILEIADVLAISKGDLPMAEQTALDMREMLGLRQAAAPGAWATPVQVVSAPQNLGLTELLATIDRHRAHRGHGLRLAPKRAPIEHGPDPEQTDAAALARVRRFVAADALCQTLGFRVADAGLGWCQIALTVDARHINFNGGCHGGVTFSLADTAFGNAANSYGRFAAGIDAHITYQAGVREGDELVASAVEVSRGRRLGVYRVDVSRTDAAGQTQAVSSFTGTVYFK